MGLFGKKKKQEPKAPIPAARSPVGNPIKKEPQPLDANLEGYAKELLNAYAQQLFGNDSGDRSKPVYWENDCLKGPLREKAEEIDSEQGLQQVYQRVMSLAQERDMSISGRYMSILFEGIDGWRD